MAKLHKETRQGTPLFPLLQGAPVPPCTPSPSFIRFVSSRIPAQSSMAFSPPVAASPRLLQPALLPLASRGLHRPIAASRGSPMSPATFSHLGAPAQGLCFYPRRSPSAAPCISLAPSALTVAAIDALQ
eukprot:Gb_10077 [translate_table: standard]